MLSCTAARHWTLSKPKNRSDRSGRARTEVSWGWRAHLLLACQGQQRGYHTALTRNLKLRIQASEGSEPESEGTGGLDRAPQGMDNAAGATPSQQRPLPFSREASLQAAKAAKAESLDKHEDGDSPSCASAAQGRAGIALSARIPCARGHFLARAAPVHLMRIKSSGS